LLLATVFKNFNKTRRKMLFSRTLLCLLSAASIATIISGCKTPPCTGSYQSFREYKKAAYGKVAKKTVKYEGVARNPVIIVHGFLGAKLMDPKTKKNVWGDFRMSDDLNILPPARSRSLAVPMTPGKALKDLKSSALVSGMLEDANVRVFGMNVSIGSYSRMIKILSNAGYCPENQPLPEGKKFKTLFLFAYDWRRDLPYNAALLDKFIAQKKAYLQKQYEIRYGLKNYDVQFDIIAHSMGGLLSRYYLRYGKADLPADGSIPKPTWDGSKKIDKLLIVGTPNGGYLDTVLEMTRGMRVDPAAPMVPPAVLGTWATYYQMMPPVSTRSVVYADDPEGDGIDIFDPKVWIKFNWGLADPKQDKNLKVLLPNVKKASERRKIALEHLTKCLKRAKQFTDTMRIHSNPPEDVKLFLFQGDAVMTTRRATVDRKTGELKVGKKGYEPGDGKVLCASSLWDERMGMQCAVPFYIVSPIQWQAVYRLTAAHMGITKMEVFADNMTACLLLYATPSQIKRRKTYKKYYKMNW
jgi:Lecithin:cholesterol acyltransferase